MIKNNLEVFEKTKAYAFLLLKFRLRSENELRGRLLKKKFEPEIVDKLIEFLKEKRFLDDQSFTKSWIEFRLKKPFGLRRIRQELNQKGISKQIIERHLSQVKEEYHEEEVVAGIIKNKLSKASNLDPQKFKSRVYGYLLRRGFSPEIIIEQVNQIKS